MNLRGIAILLAASAALACGVAAPAVPTATPIPPPSPSTAPTAPIAPAPATDTPTTAGATLPSGTGACTATASGDVTAYERPSFQAAIFSSTVPSPQEITSRTTDGWLGFDPGKAQAANIGVFRQRWIPPDAAVTLTGNCTAVPVEAWVPAAGVCYEMVMDKAEVHASADPASAVNGTLKVGDFAAIVGRTASGWLSISGDQANSPGVNGFMADSDANFNGPCDSIPIVPG
jgi:hypothetical protein